MTDKEALEAQRAEAVHLLELTLELNNLKELRAEFDRSTRLGISGPLMVKAKEMLSELTKDAVHHAVSNHRDDDGDHLHIRKLSDALKHAGAEGHTSPQVQAAQKLRSEKFPKLLESYLKAEDLVGALDLIRHARDFGLTEFDAVVVAATQKVHAASKTRISAHKSVGAESHHKLDAAIKVCRSESIGDEGDLAEATKTLSFERDRDSVRTMLGSAVDSNDLFGIVEGLGIAEALNISDPEVSAGRTHLHTQVAEDVRAAVAKGSRRLAGGNGTADESNDAEIAWGDIHRLAFLAQHIGLPETDAGPLKDMLRRNERSRLDKAMAAKIDMHVNGFENLIELEHALAGQYLREQDRTEGAASLQSKVSALVAASATMPLEQTALVLKFASREASGYTETSLASHISAFEQKLLSDLQADPATAEERIRAGIKAWLAVEDVFNKWPHLSAGAVGGKTLGHVAQRAIDWAEAESERSDALSRAERFGAEGDVQGLREAIRDAQNHGVPAAKVAPFEAQLKQLGAGGPAGAKAAGAAGQAGGGATEL